MDALVNRPPCGFSAQAPQEDLGSADDSELRCAVAWTTSRKNEDRHSYSWISACGRKLPFYAVFDGHEGSEVADKLSKLFANYFADQLTALDDQSIEKAFATCCIELDKTAGTANPEGGGSTAICAVLVDKRMHIACVGDSVAQYCLGKQSKFLSKGADVCDADLRRFAFQHDGWKGGRERFFITQYGGSQDPRGFDFHWHRQVTWYADGSGASIRTQAKKDYKFESQKGWSAFKLKGKEGALAMARSIGDAMYQVPATPTVSHLDIAAGGRLILASDGFYDVCSPAEAATCVSQLDGTLKAQAEALVGGALAAGSSDDVTVLIVDL